MRSSRLACGGGGRGSVASGVGVGCEWEREREICSCMKCVWREGRSGGGGDMEEGARHVSTLGKGGVSKVGVQA
eukprot:363635-Chlamydomonas_euryale.AAC.1